MIRKVHDFAAWLGNVSEKAKAVVGGLGAFAAVVVTATADDELGLDEIPTIVTAGITFAALVYGLVWAIRNKGFVKVDDSNQTGEPPG